MRPVRLFAWLMLAAWTDPTPSAAGADSGPPAPVSAADTSFRGLIDALEERRMPDVMLWAVESAGRDPSLSEATRTGLPSIRATALVALSRTEADPQKRSTLLDEAESSLDGFLATSPPGDGLIDALVQKGNLLVERGRGKLAQAARPGADVAGLRAQAAAFFDEAIATLGSPAAQAAAGGGVPVNAEDAVQRVLQGVDAEIDRIREPLREVRGRVTAKEQEIRPVAELVDRSDRDLHSVKAEQATVQNEIARNRASIVQLRTPPQPREGNSRRDPRLLREPLPAKQRENLAEAARLEQENQALMQKFQHLEDQRRKKLGERRQADTELSKLKKERTALDRELDAAQKPLEARLEGPLRMQETLRVKLLQTRFLAAEAQFEKSRAFDPSTADWKKAVEASTAAHRKLVETYGTMGVASMARLSQGRNEALLGDHAAAVVTLAPLYRLESAPGQPVSALGMSLKTRALAIALESWAATKQYREVTGPEPFDVTDYRKNDLLRFALAPAKGGKPDADLATVKYRTAILLEARASDIAGREPQAADLLRADALKLAREVSRAGRDYARESRDLAARLGKDLPDVAADDFTTLVADGRAAVTAMQERILEAKRLQAEGHEVEERRALEQAATERDRAIGLLEKAIAMAHDGSTKGTDGGTVDPVALADLRATLAFLLYDAKRFDEAAAIGSDLVVNQPNAPGSRRAAKVALASLQAQMQRGDADARREAGERLMALARLVLEAWPMDDEGSDALAILVAEALERRDPTTIRDMIAAMPATVPRRADFLMRLGTALRREAREASTADAGGQTAHADLAAWNTAAAEAIDEGLAAMENAGGLPPDSGGKVAVAAALARAQMALETADFPRVERLLDHPVYGPLTVAQSGDPVLSQGPLADAARAVALRYFVETQRPDGARDVLLAMEKAAGESADASARLVATFLAISRDLQAQFDALTTGPRAGTPEARQQAAAILEAFETVLEGLRSRDAKFASQFFVADAYLSLTLSEKSGSAVPKAKADEFLARAADGFMNLLARTDDSTATAEERAEAVRFEPTTRRRLMTALRRQGRWDEAQRQLDWILADPQRQNSLDVQREAAELLEAAGRAVAAVDPLKADSLLREAAAGRQADQAQIWGWGGIANKLARQAFASDDDAALKLRDRFFDARIRVAQTFLERARLPGQSDRAKRLETAASAIAMTRKLYPDLGGPALERRFEAVLEEIQREQGATAPGGFGQLDRESAATTP